MFKIFFSLPRTNTLAYLSNAVMIKKIIITPVKKILSLQGSNQGIPKGKVSRYN